MSAFHIEYKSALSGKWINAWHLGGFTTERRALNHAKAELPGYEVRASSSPTGQEANNG